MQINNNLCVVYIPGIAQEGIDFTLQGVDVLMVMFSWFGGAVERFRQI